MLIDLRDNHLRGPRDSGAKLPTYRINPHLGPNSLCRICNRQFMHGASKTLRLVIATSRGYPLSTFGVRPCANPAQIFFVRMPPKNQGLRKILQKAVQSQPIAE